MDVALGNEQRGVCPFLFQGIRSFPISQQSSESSQRHKKKKKSLSSLGTCKCDAHTKHTKKQMQDVIKVL